MEVVIFNVVSAITGNWPIIILALSLVQLSQLSDIVSLTKLVRGI